MLFYQLLEPRRDKAVPVDGFLVPCPPDNMLLFLPSEWEWKGWLERIAYRLWWLGGRRVAHEDFVHDFFPPLRLRYDGRIHRLEEPRPNLWTSVPGNIIFAGYSGNIWQFADPDETKPKTHDTI